MPLSDISALSAIPAVSGVAPAVQPTAAAGPAGVGNPAMTALTGTAGTAGVTDPAGAERVTFGDVLGGQVDALQGLQGHRDSLSLRAVTGDLQDVHEATIAAAKASTTMDLMVAMRNTGLQAFNELMRIQA